MSSTSTSSMISSRSTTSTNRGSAKSRDGTTFSRTSIIGCTRERSQKRFDVAVLGSLIFRLAEQLRVIDLPVLVLGDAQADFGAERIEDVLAVPLGSHPFFHEVFQRHFRIAGRDILVGPAEIVARG